MTYLKFTLTLKNLNLNICKTKKTITLPFKVKVIVKEILTLLCFYCI